MIRHHPDDSMLMTLAAGRLGRGAAVVTEAHIEGCPHCRARMREFDAVGGALLEAAEPALLAPEALARSLARIDGGEKASSPTPRTTPYTTGAHPPLPGGVAWPRSLRRSTATRWRWLGPGMRWSRVTLADDRAANVFLLRIAAGKSLPAHTHRGIELTQVLHGAFDDGRARFAIGDFDATDGSIHHQPVVDATGECICLASVDGRVAFDGRIAQMFGSLVGM